LGDDQTLLEAAMSTTTETSMDHPTPRRRTRRSLLAVVAVALLAVALAGCMPDDARTFLDRTNSLRRSYGIAALKEHGTLTDKAEDWARHMAATGRLEHSTLSAGLSGVSWTALGENVGYSSATSNTLLTIHNNFVSSTAHKANLLDSRFTHMGVGVHKDSAGRVWVVEVFARL
jgi:uncharacterized protein YkwD